MYKALLIAPDGDWVTDFSGRNTIAEVIDELADMGSRWYFYPYHFVITDTRRSFTSESQRIVSAPDELDYLIGRTIRTASREVYAIAPYL